MDNIDDIKQKIRNQIEEQRRILGEDLIKEQSLVIQSRLLSMSEYRMAKVICAYLSIKGEVRTDSVITRCMLDEKTVCVPAFDKAAKIYRPAVYDTKTSVSKGLLGVLEPSSPVWLDVSAIDMVIVPGVAFDETGSRLGRGGGYYDSILGGMRAFKVAVAFDFQMISYVPIDDTDVNVDAVITESRVIRSSMESRSRS